MRRAIFAALLVLALVAVAGAAPFQNLVQGVFFTDPLGNDALAGIVYTRISDSETLEFQLTTADTVAYTMDNAVFTIAAGNTFALEGSTADANESIFSSADVTADVTYTLRDVTSGVYTFGAFSVSHCTGPLAADSLDVIVFLADRAYTVTAIKYIHQVKETDNPVAVMPQRLQGTEDVSGGNDLIQAAFDSDATANNTVVSGTLTATTAFLTLAAGDRLALDFTGDPPGELANVCVTFNLVPD